MLAFHEKSRTFVPWHPAGFFFSNAALLKTVAVMSLLELSQKRSHQPWLSRPRHHRFTAWLFEGPQLVVVLFSNSSSTPPTRPFIVRHLSSRFCTPDTLAIPGLHTPKFGCSRPWVWSRGFLASSAIFRRSFLSANSSLICLLCCLIYHGRLFNGPLYIPVVSLALLTEGRTARDLPKQRWSQKKQKRSHQPGKQNLAVSYDCWILLWQRSVPWWSVRTLPLTNRILGWGLKALDLCKLRISSIWKKCWWPCSLHWHDTWTSLSGMWPACGWIFSPIATSERMKLFMAAHKLLMFVLHDASAQTFHDEEQALHAALKPLRMASWLLWPH